MGRVFRRVQGYSMAAVLVAASIMGVVVMAGVAALDYLRKGTGYIQGVQQKVDASSSLNMVFNSPALCENSFFKYQTVTNSNGTTSRVLVSGGQEFVPTMEMLSPADREALQAEVGRANSNPLFAGLEVDPIRVGVGMQPFRMTQASQTAFESTRTARNARPAPAASPTSTSAPAVLANLDMIRLGSSVAPVVIEVGGRFSGSTVTSLTIRPLPVAAVSVAPQEFFGWTANEKVSVGYAELDIRFANSAGGVTLAPIKKTFQYAVGVVSRRLRACSLNGGLLANPVFASQEATPTPSNPIPPSTPTFETSTPQQRCSIVGGNWVRPYGCTGFIGETVYATVYWDDSSTEASAAIIRGQIESALRAQGLFPNPIPALATNYFSIAGEFRVQNNADTRYRRFWFNPGSATNLNTPVGNMDRMVPNGGGTASNPAWVNPVGSANLYTPPVDLRTVFRAGIVLINRRGDRYGSFNMTPWNGQQNHITNVPAHAMYGGVACNSAGGWRIASCSGQSNGADGDYFVDTRTQSCVSNDVFQLTDGTISLSCVRNP